MLNCLFLRPSQGSLDDVFHKGEKMGQVSTSIRNPFLVLWEFGKHHQSSFEVCDYVSQRNVGEDAASAEEMEKALHIMGFETEETLNS